MIALFAQLARHDERMLHAVVLQRSAPFDRLMRTVTHGGDARWTLGVTLALIVGPWPGAQSLGMRIAFVLVLSHLFVQLLKRTIDRPRPRLPVGYASLIEAPDRFSFPSGHSAASLSVVLPIVVGAAPAVAAPVLAGAFLVGISRCYLGVHYPGDVLVGWLLAILAAVVGTLAFAPML